MTRLLLPALLLLTASTAAAQGLASPTVTRRQGIVSVSFQGKLPAQAQGKGALVARLMRGSSSALQAAVDVAPGGTCTIRFRTPRLLLADRYDLALATQAQPKRVLVRVPVRVGTKAEASAAQRRMLDWYTGAVRTFRELTVALERRGAFHLALARRSPDERHLAVYRTRFLPQWTMALRLARMDLATYQRRLLLPYKPELGTELVGLFKLLKKRRDAWTKAIGKRKGPPAAAPLQAAAARIVKLLGQPASRAAEWSAGPLGKPVKAPKPGPHTDPIGFKLTIPASAVMQPLPNPTVRLSFRIEPARVRVEVLELPDEKTAKELIQRVELGAWEGRRSYKRLEREVLKDGAGIRLEFTTSVPIINTTRFLTLRVIQHSRFPKGGGRVISLVIERPEGKPLPDALLKLADTFKVSP